MTGRWKMWTYLFSKGPTVFKKSDNLLITNYLTKGMFEAIDAYMLRIVPLDTSGPWTHVMIRFE